MLAVFPDGMRIGPWLIEKIQMRKIAEDGNSCWIAIWSLGYIEEVMPSPVKVFRAGNFSTDDEWDLEFDDLSTPFENGCFHYRVKKLFDFCDGENLEEVREYRKRLEDKPNKKRKVERFWEGWIERIIGEHLR